MLKDFRSIFIPIFKDFRGKTELSFPEIMFHSPVNVHSCTGGGVLSKISGRGVPPTVSKWNRWLDQFL